MRTARGFAYALFCERLNRFQELSAECNFPVSICGGAGAWLAGLWTSHGRSGRQIVGIPYASHLRTLAGPPTNSGKD